MVGFSTASPDKTTVNEDAARAIEVDGRRGVLVVADGLGGGRGGEQAASTTIESLDVRCRAAAGPAEAAREMAGDGSGSAGGAEGGSEGGSEDQRARGANASASGPHGVEEQDDAVARDDVVEGEDGVLRGAILSGIDEAHSRIREMQIGAGATLALVEIDRRRVRSYHVGDAMVLVTGQRGKLKLKTVCHSPVGFGVEAGLIGEEEAMHHDERHVVLNALGHEGMRVEMGSAVEMSERDTLLVSSDGLFDNLTMEEIVERIRCGDLYDAACELARAAWTRMTAPAEGQPSKPDDLTFVLYRKP